jgi:D-alanyl-D-alanine carboxypeptidase/D-alanyl-D-alanine-endopeptidase (penicillin-binding protein 4)
MGSGGARRARGYLVVVALLALTAYGAGDALDVVPGVLTTAGSDDRSAVPRVGAPPTPPPATPRSPAASNVSGPLVVDGTAVLPAADEVARVPGRAALAAAVAGPLRNPALGPSVALVVQDYATGAVLLAIDAARPRVPASTAKVFTAFAIASSADLDARALTSVRSGPAADQITLVAGGDTLLARGRGTPTAIAGHAGLADLADQVARELARSGRPSVRLTLDARAGAGPAYAPGWLTADLRLGLTGPVTNLALAEHSAVPGRPSPADPAEATAQAFRAALVARKITVTGPLTRLRAGRLGAELGRVESAPLGQVLQRALATSDNALTEALARRVAVAQGAAPTFASVTAWIRGRLAAAGVGVNAVRLADASGLSRASTVPAAQLAAVLALARQDAYRSSFGDLIANLPVAGLSGTMTHRFRTAATVAGAGVVRAKTGTLTGVASLAGSLVDADGRLLLFVVMADRTPGPPVGGIDRSRAALDEVVAAVASCGCR